MSIIATDGRRAKDMAGQRFGRWLVIERSVSINGSKKNTKWLCRCDCGTERVVAGNELRRGKTTSCGCAHLEKATNRLTRHGHARKSGASPEYNSWRNMRSRCECEADISYHRYGGRGIRVCDRWLDFANFLADMGAIPGPGYSLDRYPDNNGHYEPGNVRWATDVEQARNRRSSSFIEANGIRLTIAGWSEVTGLSRRCIGARILAGWSPSAAVTVKSQREGQSKKHR